MLHGTKLLYKILRDYLVLNGLKYVSYPGHCTKKYGIESCFFTDQEERTHAIKCLTDIQNVNIRPSNFTTHAGNSSQNDESIPKLAHCLSHLQLH